MADFARVHIAEYLRKLAAAELTAAEQRRMGLSWSVALWERAQISAAGTYAAARASLTRPGRNLAGGGHHAFADHGEEFCVLNDAIAKLIAAGAIGGAAVFDLDVHQGNGTADIFQKSPKVFTFSIHGERNTQAKGPVKPGPGASRRHRDAAYLEALDANLPRVLSFSLDLVVYVAGVDVAQGDCYGRLALSDEGIARRDALVINHLRDAGRSLAIVLGGGYAPRRERTVALHALALQAGRSYERKPLDAVT